MIGVICALLIAIWFWRSAGRVGKSKIGWALLGLISYYVPNLSWQFIVTLSVREGVLDAVRMGPGAENVGLILLIASVFIGVALGIGSAVLVHRRLLSSTSQDAQVDAAISENEGGNRGRAKPWRGPGEP